MTKKYWLAVVASLSIVVPIFLGGSSALAAGQDIAITPTSSDQVLDPGSTTTGSFQVIDQGKTDYDFQVYATPYRVSGESYSPEFTALPNSPNITSWFKFSIDKTRIVPEQSVTVNYTLTIPKNTPAGGYYAVAFAETKYPTVANASSVIINERVGEIFYIRVAGPVVEKGELLTWASSWLQKPPLTTTMRLKDDGTIHYRADLVLTVRDIFGNAKFTLKTSKEILPQTIRKTILPWDKTPSIGLFKVNGNLTFLGHTQNLPTRYVLVMSQTVRIYFLVVLAILVLFVIFRYMKRSTGYAKRNKKYYKR